MFLKVTFQHIFICSSGGRRGTERNLDRQERVLFHIEVRTLYARRMFREICKSSGESKENNLRVAAEGRALFLFNSIVLLFIFGLSS